MEEVSNIIIYSLILMFLFTLISAVINHYHAVKLQKKVDTINNNIRKKIDEIDGILYDKYKKR